MVLKDLINFKINGRAPKWRIGTFEDNIAVTDDQVIFFIPKNEFFIRVDGTTLTSDSISDVVQGKDDAEDFEFINRIEIIKKTNACVLAPILTNAKYKMNVMIDKKYFDFFENYCHFKATTPSSVVFVYEDDKLVGAVMPYLR
jgi:hypothetical protein